MRNARACLRHDAAKTESRLARSTGRFPRRNELDMAFFVHHDLNLYFERDRKERTVGWLGQSEGRFNNCV